MESVDIQTSDGPVHIEIATAISITALTLDKFKNVDPIYPPLVFDKGTDFLSDTTDQKEDEPEQILDSGVASQDETSASQQKEEVPIDTLETDNTMEGKVADEYSDNKIQEKFQSFREKFLDREAQADTWEDTIIQKQDQRIVHLRNFADVLDKENEVLKGFISEKLGQ